MPLTRSFKETVQARAERDPEYRNALLEEAVNLFLEGDLETGKGILRDYINATVGFEGLSALTHIGAKSLMRMFGPHGNPSASNLFAAIHALQQQADVRLEVATVEKLKERIVGATPVHVE